MSYNYDYQSGSGSGSGTGSGNRDYGRSDYADYYGSHDYNPSPNRKHRPDPLAMSSNDLVAAASGGGDCCPHVVDPLLFTAALVAIPVAVFYLNQQITMNLGRKRRRKRNLQSEISSLCFESEPRHIINGAIAQGKNYTKSIS